jgi:hypothetical protein
MEAKPAASRIKNRKVFIVKKFLLILVVLLIPLSGCAANHTRSFDSSAKICRNAAGVESQSKILAIRVASGGTGFSDAMLLGLLKMGVSTGAVDSLVDLLSLPSGAPVAVIGSDNAIVAATIKAALDKLPANTQRPPQLLCVFNDVRLSPSLRQAAADANVLLLPVNESIYAVEAYDANGERLSSNLRLLTPGDGIHAMRNTLCNTHPEATVVIRDVETNDELAGESPYQCRTGAAN